MLSTAWYSGALRLSFAPRKAETSRSCAVQPWVSRVDGEDMVLVGRGWMDRDGWRGFRLGQNVGRDCYGSWQHSTTLWESTMTLYRKSCNRADSGDTSWKARFLQY